MFAAKLSYLSHRPCLCGILLLSHLTWYLPFISNMFSSKPLILLYVIEQV